MERHPSQSVADEETVISMEGGVFLPAVIEGNVNVFETPNFILVKRSWQPDQECAVCCLCKIKFGGLKRRHHCRQCGRVICNKCCNTKIPIPQLGSTESERVCDSCKPVTIAVAKARSQMTAMQLTAAYELEGMCRGTDCIKKMFEFGGFHTLLALAGIHLETSNTDIMGHVVGALHTLSTYEPVQKYMASNGIIHVLARVLEKCKKEQVLMDCISALIIYCKSPIYLDIVLGTAVLPSLLTLCGNSSDTVVLMTVSMLSLLLERSSTHSAIVDSDKSALQTLLKMAASTNSQMQAVSLKCLTYLSMGTDWNKHRILQEDFTAGKPLVSTLQTETFNMQVWSNAACLIANLATSKDDQNCLSDSRDILLELLKTDISNIDVFSNIARGVANFSKFPQNATKICSYLPDIISKCLSIHKADINQYALKIIFNTLVFETENTVKQLLINGAGDVFTHVAGCEDVTTAIVSAVDHRYPELARPL